MAVLAACLFFVCHAPLSAGEETLDEAGAIFSARLDGPITPVSAEIVTHAIETAEKANAALLVIGMDTPGGLMDSMQSIKQDILESKVPVAVYVSPKGAHATSAGFFILMAADLAVMAPGSTGGSAHPVGLGGGEMDEIMMQKVTNAAVSEMRSIAEARGRNPEMATETVEGEINSYTAEEALAGGLIDFIAKDLDDLIAWADGREITRFTGEKQTLHLVKSTTVIEPTLRQKVLAVIANPNILFLLFGIGMAGIYAEVYNPGLIFPGVIGVLSLIMALWATQILPINYAGVLFILLAFALFIAEVQVTSFGLLTVGGVVSLFLGGLFLMKHPVPGLEIDWGFLIGVTALITLFIVTLLILVIRAHKLKVTTGRAGLVGERGEATVDFGPEGKVFVHGEYWNAVTADPSLKKGSKIVITEVRGSSLVVELAAD